MFKLFKLLLFLLFNLNNGDFRDWILVNYDGFEVRDFIVLLFNFFGIDSFVDFGEFSKLFRELFMFVIVFLFILKIFLEYGCCFLLKFWDSVFFLVVIVLLYLFNGFWFFLFFGLLKSKEN